MESLFTNSARRLENMSIVALGMLIGIVIIIAVVVIILVQLFK